MATRKKLVYAEDVLHEILKHEPKLSFILERVKAVDAKPVVRTSWEKEPIGYGFYRERCKACGEWSLGMDKPYCPMCGAEADGGANDGN